MNGQSNGLTASLKFGDAARFKEILCTDVGKALALKQDSSGRNALMHASLASPTLQVMSFVHAYQSFRSGGLPGAKATPDSELHTPEPKLLDTEFVCLLLALPSAQTQARAIDDDGKNALMYAIDFERLLTVRQLLILPSADEQALVRDNKGRNAMMLAIEHRGLTVFDWLLNLPSGKAQLDNRDNMGHNVTDYMKKYLDEEMLENMTATVSIFLQPGKS